MPPALPEPHPSASRRANAGPDLLTVLDEDAALAGQLDPPRLARARPLSMAAALRVAPGGALPGEDRAVRAGYGLLLLGGCVIRQVSVDGRAGAELLAAGDLLRPWPEADETEAPVAAESGWQVLTPATLAVLDRRWMVRMAPFPEVGAALTRRSLERLERLLTMLAIAGERRLEARLWLLLRHLAERHGRAHRDGVQLSLPLTHDLLAHLGGARRPSVSSALARLAADGRVRRERGGWILARRSG